MKLFLPYHHKKIEVSLSPKNLASVIMPQEVSPIPDVPQTERQGKYSGKHMNLHATWLILGETNIIIPAIIRNVSLTITGS